MTIRERCGNAEAVTIVEKKWVYYSVAKVDGENRKVMWNKTVRFGRDKNNRPGGFNFVYTAREQEKCLRAIA